MTLNSYKRAILAFILPVVLLLGGAGVGIVVAAEKPYSPPSGEEAFAAAPSSLVMARSADQAARAMTQATRDKAATAKRKCKRKRGAAKRKCLKRAKLLERPRYMPLPRAEAIAEDVAQRIWEDNIGGYEWTEYGTSDCRRLARNSVSCSVWVYYQEENYGYEDYGSIYDCEWVVNAKYLAGGKLDVTSAFGDRVCEWSGAG